MATITRESYAVIGGGIIGLALAHKLTLAYPGARIVVFEKEPQVCRHQSGHNSGVLHSGLYYRPGSLKAQLAVSGIRQMKEFCQQHGVPHEECGKLVVACPRRTPATARSVGSRHAKRPARSRLAGPRGDSGDRASRGRHRLGPCARGGNRRLRTGLPGSAAPDRSRRRIRVHLVAGARSDAGRRGWRVSAGQREERVDFFFNCAGLHCDRVLVMAGERRHSRIIPFRGEYYKLIEVGRDLVRNLIYPVPDPRFPFLGVHFTRMIHGGVEAGPNAVLAMAREGYRKTDFRLADVADVFTFGGFWRSARYPSMCMYEFYLAQHVRILPLSAASGARCREAPPLSRRRGHPRPGAYSRWHARARLRVRAALERLAPD